MLSSPAAVAILHSFSEAWGPTSQARPRPQGRRALGCVSFLFLLFLSSFTPVCLRQGHLPSEAGGRRCGWEGRRVCGRAAELSGRSSSPAQVPAGHAGPLAPGSLRQAWRSECLCAGWSEEQLLRAPGVVIRGQPCPCPPGSRPGRVPLTAWRREHVCCPWQLRGPCVDAQAWNTSEQGGTEGGGCPCSAVDDHFIGKNYTRLKGGDFAARVPLTRGSSASPLPGEAVPVRAVLCGVEERLRACGLSDTLTLGETSHVPFLAQRPRGGPGPGSCGRHRACILLGKAQNRHQGAAELCQGLRRPGLRSAGHSGLGASRLSWAGSPGLVQLGLIRGSPAAAQLSSRDAGFCARSLVGCCSLRLAGSGETQRKAAVPWRWGGWACPVCPVWPRVVQNAQLCCGQGSRPSLSSQPLLPAERPRFHVPNGPSAFPRYLCFSEQQVAAASGPRGDGLLASDLSTRPLREVGCRVGYESEDRCPVGRSTAGGRW